MKTPLTDAAIADSFQTGPHYKVKAEAMRSVEIENQSLREQVRQLRMDREVTSQIRCAEIVRSEKYDLALEDTARLDWLDANLLAHDSASIFGREIEIGKLRDAIDQLRFPNG